MRLTLKWMLNWMKSSYIWPRSAAFPWEYNKVELAMGCLIYIATISVPLLVGNLRISTFSRWGYGLRSKRPVSSSVISLYEGGFGGKKANFAAIDEVTPPILYYSSPVFVALTLLYLPLKIFVCMCVFFNYREENSSLVFGCWTI